MAHRFLYIYLLAISLMAFLPSCASKRKSTSFSGADFSLEDTKKNAAAIKGSKAAAAVKDIPTHTSLPLPIRVGKGNPRFKSIPQKAYDNNKVYAKFSYKTCLFQVFLGPVVVDRYIKTNRWIKMKSALRRMQPVKIDKNMYGNFLANMGLYIHISSVHYETCRKVLKGRRVYLGKFNINQTKFAILSPVKKNKPSFTSKSSNKKSRKVYINWPDHKRYPQLQDYLGLLSSDDTPIFRAKFTVEGSYYISVLPFLSFKPEKGVKIIK